MRARSLRMQRLYRQRRQLVAHILETHPVCQRCGFARSSEVHEVKSRARGGSILNAANCRAICHDCHAFITTHPRQALAEGLAAHSWDEEAAGDFG